MKPFPFKNMLVRHKMLAITTLSTGVALLLALAILVSQQWFLLRDQLIDTVSSQATIITANSAVALKFKDVKSAELTLGTLVGGKEIDFAMISDKDGRHFAGYARPGEPSTHHHAMPPGDGYFFAANHLEVYRPIVFDGEQIGQLDLHASLTSLKRAMWLSVMLYVATALGAMGIALLMISRLQGVITGPIARLIGSMDRVSGEGNYALRVKLRSKDELGVLGERFNDMLAQIQQRDAALARYSAQLEQEVEQRTARLTEAQRMGHLGNWEWDVIDNSVVWSDEIYRILGHAQTSGGSTEAYLRAVHPHDLQLVQEQFGMAIKRSRAFNMDHRIERPDGALRHVHLEVEVTRGESGKTKLVFGTVQDITERKLGEHALMAAREEAERANRAKSEFLSSMSHELRTPMNAILGFGQLMEYDTELSGDQRENVREILKAGHHLLGLISEVLDLAKVESGRIELSLEPVELCSVLDECLSLVGSLAEKSGIRISHTVGHGVAVRADRTRLKQALLNLLSNAIKYNREGGSVHLDLRPEGTQRLRLRVTDTGPGIPAHRLSELFQPFNRLDAENSEIEGTGIGLTITRRIVEMMGGTVDVDSEPGVGSCFWIELPIDTLPEDVDADEDAQTREATARMGLDGQRHKVLYIEDNPANIKLVVATLSRRRHVHLLTAHTPELGIELAMVHQPELILLDINLPGMDGYQVLKILKSDARLKHIPVVAVTANAMPSDIARGQASAFADYLTKPLDVVKFRALIDRYLGAERTDDDAA